MQIVIIKKNNIYRYPFPNDFINSYWIKDKDEMGFDRNLIVLEKSYNNWTLISNDTCKIVENNSELEKINLTLNKFYYLKNVNNGIAEYILMYVYNEDDVSYQTYKINDGEYTIGSSLNQNIIIPNVKDNSAMLIKRNNKYELKVIINTDYEIYVNDYKATNKILENGDVIFIYGYKIILLNDYIIVGSHLKELKINIENLQIAELPKNTVVLEETLEDDNAELYNENDYFTRSPRFVTSVNEEDFSIDSPPGKVEADETPVLYTIGPMFTMAMSSVVTASVSIINFLNGNGSVLSILPTIVISITMLASTILWPTLMRRYNKKRQQKKEAERQKKYIEYLTDKKNKIENLRINQFQVLMENYPDPINLLPTILNKKRNLWERQIKSEDFLNVRLGVGIVPLKINLRYSVEDFTMSTDNLKEELNKVVESAKDIVNAPVTIDLSERNKLVIIGEKKYRESMLKSLMLQLSINHSYEDLKFVLMVNDTSSDIWEDFKILPHVWSNSRDVRFYANNYEDMSKISFYLEQEFISRKYYEEDGKRLETRINYKNVRPYYLIVVDNIKKNKNIEIINKILKEENNIGYGLIILNDGISNLPNECNNFLTAAGDNSAIIKNDLNTNNQQTFKMDNVENIDFSLVCEKLANIPIKLNNVFEQKSFVSFLEMYKVGNVEQLNILERWTKNNPVNSLSVPIGIHTDGEIFNLDLHEKFHGPHGLIAGMTGSGKSEFIITFILSMCLNFSPEEVSFVLIDYKGGGLTGAFENKLTGVRLPHLAGTITNLDTAEIKRSLSSIQSELKRRQALFNKAKLELNESTLDIYKYQKLYRDGRIKEPISHLFIISDEFAELKNQQHEFMDELISTARIGRSLGVHLILATQKPSGIVDDQIWSNSKFKVCLKVQEKSDSMDVIKCPDAASLKKVGRFYLQVGYNDYFAMGQSAYAGAKYIPKDKLTKTVDRNVSFINNIGDTIKSVETVRSNEGFSLGEELPNILKYICEAAKIKGMVAKKLWLDKISKEIFIPELMNKYSFKPEKWNIVPVIGEYDDPNNQRQDLLTLNFNNSGNTLIYGAEGKELLLSSIIYSLIISHSTEELNFYIVDFGTEILGMFRNAPQVGDVVYISELEKLTNLFNILANELDRRKKIFVDFNGDYNLFIKNSGKTLPRIIVVINNYEVFTETYEDFVDVVSSLSREGEKYGISFVISATGVNAVRGKTSQNFSNQLCLNFNDVSDYSTILGPTRGMVPSNIFGRGLIKINGQIHEYQTAYPCKWDEINTFIKDTCNKLNTIVKEKALKVAVLPNFVRLSDVENSIKDLRNVPIGIEKNTLDISTFNFNKNSISLVSAQDISYLDNFVPSLAEVIQKINSLNLYMMDANEVLTNSDIFKNYYSLNYEDYLNKLEEICNNSNELSVFMIFGFDTFKSGLSAVSQDKLKSILSNLKRKNNIKIIIADSISKIKNIEYEDYYRENVQPVNALWVGSGLTEQYTIKSSTFTKETRSQLENDFGFNVNRGVATLIKTLNFYSKF